MLHVSVLPESSTSGTAGEGRVPAGCNDSCGPRSKGAILRSLSRFALTASPPRKDSLPAGGPFAGQDLHLLATPEGLRMATSSSLSRRCLAQRQMQVLGRLRPPSLPAPHPGSQLPPTSWRSRQRRTRPSSAGEGRHQAVLEPLTVDAHPPLVVALHVPRRPALERSAERGHGPVAGAEQEVGRASGRERM